MENAVPVDGDWCQNGWQHDEDVPSDGLQFCQSLFFKNFVNLAGSRLRGGELVRTGNGDWQQFSLLFVHPDLNLEIIKTICF